MLAGPLNKKACFTSKFFPLRWGVRNVPTLSPSSAAVEARPRNSSASRDRRRCPRCAKVPTSGHGHLRHFRASSGVPRPNGLKSRLLRLDAHCLAGAAKRLSRYASRKLKRDLIYLDTSKQVDDPVTSRSSPPPTPRKPGSRKTVPKAWPLSMRFGSEPHRPQALSATFAPLADGQDYPGYGRGKKGLRADTERPLKVRLRVDPLVKTLQGRQGAIWKYGVHEP
jgi:hypothetical protein